MSEPRIGSLFTGYGGLDAGLLSVIGGSVAWHCENEPAACKLLAHHWPDIPNLGDITKVKWPKVEPVDVLVGGFPCQDISIAGLQYGIQPDSRSGLWDHMAYAIESLAPSLVVIENVRGILSAEADWYMEPCSWCLGESKNRPLRALGAVLGDLATIGYDAKWCGLRASDVGATHQRYRVFITAWPTANADDSGRWESSGTGTAQAELSTAERSSNQSATDTGRLRWQQGWPTAPRETQAGWAHSVSTGRDDSPTTNPDGTRLWYGRTGQDGLSLAIDGTNQQAPTYSISRELQRWRDPRELGSSSEEEQGKEHQRERYGYSTPDSGSTYWGEYGPAIRRWELTIGVPAPYPTEIGPYGSPQLSPLFVEWMMGLPPGHVTEVPKLTRPKKLKLLGNGVVPQQAEAAIRWLLS